MRVGYLGFGAIAAGIALALGAAPAGFPDCLPPPCPVPDRTLLSKELLRVSDHGKTFRVGDYLDSRSLNGKWKISDLKSAETPLGDAPSEFSAAEFDDSKWEEIDVPLDWYVKFPEMRDNRSAVAMFGHKEGGDAKGKIFPFVRGWYRRSIDITPEELDEKRILLHFGVVGYAGKLFVNGREAGIHTGDFIPWNVDITDFLKTGRNQIALRVDSDFGRIFGGLPKVVRTYGSQWSKDNIRAGLWRDVSLEIRPKLRFGHILIDPELASRTIAVRCEIDNTTGKDFSGTLLGALTFAGDSADHVQKAAEATSLALKPGINRLEFKIPAGDLKEWSPADPNLYFLTLAIRDEKGNILSADAARFGMREFKVAGTGFYLNGKRIYLFGENIASINYEGRTPDSAADRRQVRKKLAGFRANGYNIIRNGHMPMPEYYAEIADELGMMLYNEWSWGFTGQIDEKAFEANNLREFSEWVLRDYNHPSVVMYSGGNEIENGSSPEVPRQLDKQVEQLRAIDRSGRPMCAFSGNGLAYVPVAVKGDFLDAHIYYGLSHMSWTLARDAIRNYTIPAMRKIYQDGKTLKRPMVIWEYGGFSWGDRYNPKASLGTIGDYLKYAAEIDRSSVGSPRVISYSGSIGVEGSLLRGNAWARGFMGKRLSEAFRQIPEIQGIAPWYQDSNLKMARIWNQPVLVGLRDAKNFLPPHNVFSGKPVIRDLFIVNSSNEELHGLTADFILIDPSGKTRKIGDAPVKSVPAWSDTGRDVAVDIPADWSGSCRLLVTLRNRQGREVSRNFYDLELQDPSILTEPVPVSRKIALVDHGDQVTFEQTAAILKALSVPFDRIPPKIEAFGGYDWIVIPPSRNNHPTRLPQSADMLEFVRKGGSILQLEQVPGAPGLFDRVAAVGAPSSRVDICVWDHPAFEGMSRDAFDLWDNPDYGLVIRDALLPVGRTSLAARGPFMHQKAVFSAVNEGRLGRGRIFSSQLAATPLWGVDSAASRYLRNVIAYVAGGEPVARTPKLENFSAYNYDTERTALEPVDLSGVVNRSFSDQKDNDGKGGWTDQGSNDFRMMPLGSVDAAGVTFQILDPAANHGKSCVVLRGGRRPNFPDRVTGIPVRRKFGRLFFLHGSAWGVRGQEVARYRIHYADGTTADDTLVEGRNIGDWWNCVNLPEARVGIARSASGARSIGLGVAAWNNPRPDVEIESIDLLTPGAASSDKIDYMPANGGLPILVAITGEKASAQKLKLGRNGESDYDPVGVNGPKPTVSFCDFDPEHAPDDAVTLSIPGRQGRSKYTGALILRFSPELFTARNPDKLEFSIYTGKPLELKLEVPEKEWKGTFYYTLSIPGGKTWQIVTIPWSEFLKRGTVDRNSLRGEFLIYGGTDNETFGIGGIRFDR